MGSEDRITLLQQAVDELINTSGRNENTSIYPNAEVIDNAPADLPAGYIIIKDEQGFYTPAVTVSGLVVNIGDFVNVLYIKGTEPIAFQHGSASSGGGAAWPYSKVWTVDPTSTAADYNTIGAAITASAVGDIILVGAGTYGEAININKAITVMGFSKEETIITGGVSGQQAVTISDDNGILENFTINKTGTGSLGKNAGVYFTSGGTCRNVIVNITLVEAGMTHYGFRIANSKTVNLYDCKTVVSGGATANRGIDQGASGTLSIYGGSFSGTTVDLYNSGTCYLYQEPILVNNTFQTITNLYGEYIDNNGVTRYVMNYNPTVNDVPGWSGNYWYPKPGGSGSGGWPYSKVLTVDPTDPDAQYSTITAALTAAVAGSTILIGAGTYTEHLTITKAVTLRGLGVDKTIITSTDGLTIGTRAVVTFENLTINNTGSAGGGGGAYNSKQRTVIINDDGNDGGNVTFDNVRINCTTTNANGSHALEISGGAGANTVKLINDVVVTTSNSNGASTTDYGVLIDTCTVEIIGGKITGIDQDIKINGGTVTLKYPILANSLISGTYTGFWMSAAGAIFSLSDFTEAGNVIMSGASKVIKGIGSNVPNLGTTTAAEKWGNIYQGDGKDILPDNDIYGLWQRYVNYGFTPDEHWGQNADELVWTGWAAYTGATPYVTPSVISITNSIYKAANAGAGGAFRYRAASTGAAIALRCRVSITYIISAGLMIDDGVDAADSNGANNFYRVYITQASVGGAVTAVEQYRTGGGAVTTTASAFTLPPHLFVGVSLTTDGTRWTNWAGRPKVFGEAGEAINFTAGAGGFTWTPARVGLYAVFTAADGGRKAMWDWYDEATS